MISFRRFWKLPPWPPPSGDGAPPLLLFQVCLGSFLSHGQARGDAALAGLISWAKICTVLNASLGPAGREQQGSSFSRESPRGQAFELTTEACSPLSFRGLEPPPHLSPHTTWLVNGSKGLSQPAGRRKGGFFLLFFCFFKEDVKLPAASLETRRGNRLSPDAMKTSLKLKAALEGAPSPDSGPETPQAGSCHLRVTGLARLGSLAQCWHKHVLGQDVSCF